MQELKPCQFCGCDVELVGINVQRQKMMFVCGKCSAEVVLNDDVEWNTRHYPADVQQAVERMKPREPMYSYEGTGKCPVCRDLVNTTEDRNFCWNCGQALDWSNDE